MKNARCMITHTFPKPAPSVVGLAWDGSSLWAGDWESRTLMRLGADAVAVETFPAPGRMVGLLYLDGSITAVVSDPDTDDRTIRTFSIARRSWDERVLRCPGDTGSQLAWDGQHLWLGQRYEHRVMQLSADGQADRIIELPCEVVGLHWMGPTLWLNLRMRKGMSDIGRLDAGADDPELVEQYDKGYVSLAYDGGGFWMSDLRGTTIARAVPPGI